MQDPQRISVRTVNKRLDRKPVCAHMARFQDALSISINNFFIREPMWFTSIGSFELLSSKKCKRHNWLASAWNSSCFKILAACMVQSTLFAQKALLHFAIKGSHLRGGKWLLFDNIQHRERTTLCPVNKANTHRKKNKQTKWNAGDEPWADTLMLRAEQKCHVSLVAVNSSVFKL